MAVEGYMSCYKYYTITNKVAMKIYVQILFAYIFQFFMGKYL